MKISYVTHTVDSNAGGIASAIQSCMNELSKTNILSLHAYESTNPIYLCSSIYKFYLKKNIYNSFFSEGLFKDLKTFKPDAIHVHGIWSPLGHFASIYARKYNIKLVYSLHGMLDTQSLKISFFKKSIALFLWQKKDLEFSSIIHVTSEQEKINCDKIISHNHIKLIPNFIDCYAYPQKRFKIYHRRYALYLGRIHQQKGIKDLIYSWSVLTRNSQNINWSLIIAGNDENYESHLKKYALKLGLKFSVSLSDEFSSLFFLGPKFDDDKLELIHMSSIFVLPSRSENFGMVVAESLSSCTPVLTMKGTPWEDLITYNAGWWVEPDGLTNELQFALSFDDETLYQMGINGRQLILDKYSSVKISRELLLLYK